ncbi:MULTISPECIES: hypothetical protein [unclassified Chryseobacterium]|uniref:lectin-like domain-containing protein n=1 Tax=unclassified Chryseobacterium TaxID=2593645 RepID=UPI0009564E7C|nr:MULTISPECIES: hypothetical protein [unclassified Chryseobacterium]SIR55682.1 hypothetical protein SAMN05880573_1275 [Chryseobacterium sp. RU33C]
MFIKYNNLILIIFILLLNGRLSGQFSITNSFKTSENTGLRIGDNAYLTASTGADPNGSGWLRLTEAKANQKGYMYVLQGFPTTLGVVADFEYKAWRDTSDGNYNGADGFCVFLFDASVTDIDFKLGGFGGSLGYATFSNPVGTKGLSGGYLGIGLDAYGNYAAATENRNGGSSNPIPNAFVVRGPTSSLYSNSNVYLVRKELGDRSGTEEAIRKRNEIDYNTITASRPSDSVFYRRVQISISKLASDYLINIKWRKENQSDFTDVLTYTLNSSLYPMPNNLKLGFSASTGGGFNYQEIRNIILTTPGNIRVDSTSDSSFVCNEKKNSVSFKIEVTNDTNAALSNINFNGRIIDENNTLLDLSKFKITSLSVNSGFTNSNLPTSNFLTNEINGVVGLPAKSSGIITLNGEYYRKKIKSNNHFKLVSNVASSQIGDTDLTNNTFSTKIDVKRCSVITNPSLPSGYF